MLANGVPFSNIVRVLLSFMALNFLLPIARKHHSSSLFLSPGSSGLLKFNQCLWLKNVWRDDEVERSRAIICIHCSQSSNRIVCEMLNRMLNRERVLFRGSAVIPAVTGHTMIIIENVCEREKSKMEIYRCRCEMFPVKMLRVCGIFEQSAKS